MNEPLFWTAMFCIWLSGFVFGSMYGKRHQHQKLVKALDEVVAKTKLEVIRGRIYSNTIQPGQEREHLK